MVNIEELNDRKKRSMKYKSQVGQDILIDELLGGKRGGFYVDIGANDGYRFSNTYYFEKYRGWSGLLIEPLPEQFRLLQALRGDQNIKINACVSSMPCGEVDFLQAGGGDGGILDMFSCIKGYSRDNDLEKMRAGGRLGEEQLRTVRVKNLHIQFLLDILQIRQIDLLSVDIEGGEYELLRAIDYDRAHINLITVEENSHKKELDELLLEREFIFKGWIGGLDLIYMHARQLP